MTDFCQIYFYSTLARDFLALSLLMAKNCGVESIAWYRLSVCIFDCTLILVLCCVAVDFKSCNADVENNCGS